MHKRNYHMPGIQNSVLIFGITLVNLFKVAVHQDPYQQAQSMTEQAASTG
jgi:hypothetical protein